MKKKLNIIAASAILCTTFSFVPLSGLGITESLADQRCRSVDFNITNGRENEIKIYRIQYRDDEDAKSRTNNIRNTRLSPNESHDFDETLEYVGNELVRWIRVQYKERIPTAFDAAGEPLSFTWTDRRWSNSYEGLSDRVCVRNYDVNLTIN